MQGHSQSGYCAPGGATDAATDTLLEPSPLLRRADALLERLLAALREEFTDAASGALLAASTEE